MSLTLRIGALILFLAVLGVAPTSVRAWECPQNCYISGQNDPYVYVDCLDAMCIDVAGCEMGVCTFQGCTDYEAGTRSTYLC